MGSLIGIDCHVHTARCGHGSGDAVEYVAAAADAGLSVLTFTEHLPMPFVLDPNREYAMAPEELGLYVEEVSAAAAGPSASGEEPMHIEVLCGIEADWLPDHDPHVREQLARGNWDVVLGSVHFLDGWAFDDPALIYRYADVHIGYVWQRYFEEFVKAAASGLFDVMAHPDLIKKFGYRPDSAVVEHYVAAAEAMAAAGVAVEVSSAGLRKPCSEIYPAVEFLAACRERGVAATFGSDAHRPEEVAFGSSEARELLRSVGYESVVYFRSREPVEVPL